MSTKSIQKPIGYQRITIQENLEYFKSNDIKNQKTFAEEIALTLKYQPRSISPKYFYDKYINLFVNILIFFYNIKILINK